MDIGQFHRYNKLVRRGFVKPLTHSCGEVYTLRADAEGEPYLECFKCLVKVTPGLNLFEQVRTVVKEHLG